jgi:hypothetical protein
MNSRTDIDNTLAIYVKSGICSVLDIERIKKGVSYCNMLKNDNTSRYLLFFKQQHEQRMRAVGI